MDKTVVDPMIGRVLDRRYEVGPRIARGGMATVYEAVDLRLDRVVALKILHSGLDDHDFAGRFVREARAAAKLAHPHVVAVYDQGDDDGTLFLAMEYVPGQTLRDVIRYEAPMSPGRALGLLDPVLEALAAAHRHGVVHRDVKPENVLIADDGRVKVADFGLARAVSAETQAAATGGVLIGTVSYLSPELVVDGRADARTDVYAAGVVLYEMLTGRKPHQGDSPIQVAYKHVHHDVPPPSAVVPGLPPYVDALVARATARDADLRPADARVLLHQVRRVRAAVEQHVYDDPELTADLTPTTPVQRHEPPDVDVDRDVADGSAGRREDTGTIGLDDHAPTILSTAQASSAGRTDARPVRPVRHSVPPPPRRSRRGPLLLVLVLLLAVGAGGGAWWWGSGRYLPTPGVVGLTVAAAEERVEAQGLSLDVAGRAWSETVPAGRVVSTDPSGGDRVVREGTVEAVLSRGPERHAVPSLREMTLDDAQARLQDESLSFGEASSVFHEKVAKGVVLGSDPVAGTRLRRDGVVDLVVSKGPRPIKVPDWTGKDAQDATRALRRLKLDVETSRENSDTVAKGDVVSQSPDDGTLFRGDTVELVVSKGPVLVEVPTVIRMNAEEATAELEAAGFETVVQRMDVYVGLGIVVSQDPGSGTRAPRGGTVTVYVV